MRQPDRSTGLKPTVLASKKRKAAKYGCQTYTIDKVKSVGLTPQSLNSTTKGFDETPIYGEFEIDNGCAGTVFSRRELQRRLSLI